MIHLTSKKTWPVNVNKSDKENGDGYYQVTNYAN